MHCSTICTIAEYIAVYVMRRILGQLRICPKISSVLKVGLQFKVKS